MNESYDCFKFNMRYPDVYFYDDADVYDTDGDFFRAAYDVFILMGANGIEDISKIKEYLDDTNNLRFKWVIMMYYQNPEAANWAEAREKFIYDIMRCRIYDMSDEISDDSEGDIDYRFKLINKQDYICIVDLGNNSQGRLVNKSYKEIINAIKEIYYNDAISCGEETRDASEQIFKERGIEEAVHRWVNKNL